MDRCGPPGFTYWEDLLARDEEQALAGALAGVECSEIRMRGRVARRRTAHFGWRYGYETSRVEPGPPLPGFLEPLRARAARIAGVAPSTLAEALVTEYPPGAGIGWHRDAPAFGIVIGISLLAACRLRFRRTATGTRDVRAIDLAPRSAYVLRDAARWQWQHSIPPVGERRYSVTFRTVQAPHAARAGGATPPRPS